MRSKHYFDDRVNAIALVKYGNGWVTDVTDGYGNGWVTDVTDGDGNGWVTDVTDGYSINF